MHLRCKAAVCCCCRSIPTTTKWSVALGFLALCVFMFSGMCSLPLLNGKMWWWCCCWYTCVTWIPASVVA